MYKKAVLAIVAVLFMSCIDIQTSRAIDGQSVIDSYADEAIGGKRSQKIDLQCFFEESRLPARFEGTYTTISKYVDEGAGTVAIATTDKGLPPPRKVIFKRRRKILNKGGKLYVYEKTETDSVVYQIDKTLRAFALHQQDPVTDPLPFTEIYAGTCWGVF